MENGINWAGDNEVANHLAMSGLEHYVNIEFEPAYALLQEAVELDPTLFAPHTLLAVISRGEKREHHKSMAKKHVESQNETSKLFVSLLDHLEDTTEAAVEERRAIWTKMHSMSNGPYIHTMYARSMDFEADNAAVLAEFDKLIDFCNANGFTAMEAAAYNLKGYLLQISGDLEGGIAAIEKYMEIYPEGYNPIDSRAEFYLMEGDTVSAIEWYKKVVEINPFAQGAWDTLDELEGQN